MAKLLKRRETFVYFEGKSYFCRERMHMNDDNNAIATIGRAQLVTS